MKNQSSSSSSCSNKEPSSSHNRFGGKKYSSLRIDVEDNQQDNDDDDNSFFKTNAGGGAKTLSPEKPNSFHPQPSSTSTNAASGKKRRLRRKKCQIDRKFYCKVPGCNKAYGSEGSLIQHVRLKHRRLSSNNFPASPPTPQFSMKIPIPARPPSTSNAIRRHRHPSSNVSILPAAETGFNNNLLFSSFDNSNGNGGFSSDGTFDVGLAEWNNNNDNDGTESSPTFDELLKSDDMHFMLSSSEEDNSDLLLL